MDKLITNKLIAFAAMQKEMADRGWDAKPQHEYTDTIPQLAQRILYILYDIAGNVPIGWSPDMSITINASGCQIKFNVQSLSDTASQQIDVGAVKEAIRWFMERPLTIKTAVGELTENLFMAASIKDNTEVTVRISEVVWSAMVYLKHKAITDQPNSDETNNNQTSNM